MGDNASAISYQIKVVDETCASIDDNYTSSDSAHECQLKHSLNKAVYRNLIRFMSQKVYCNVVLQLPAGKF